MTPGVALENEIRCVHDKIFAMSEEVAEFLEGKLGFSPSIKGPGARDLLKPDEAAPMVEFIGFIFRQAVGGGAPGIGMKPQAREVVVRIRADGVPRLAKCSTPRHGKGRPL